MYCRVSTDGQPGAKENRPALNRLMNMVEKDQVEQVLIRSLAEANLSYREIARIAKCSHGSVHAELVAVRKEKQLKDQLERESMVSEISQSSNRSNAIISELSLSAEKLQIVRENIETTAKTAEASFYKLRFD